MVLKIHEFSIHTDENRNPMKLESSDSKLRSKRYPIFEIRKNLNQILVKLKNKTT